MVAVLLISIRIKTIFRKDKKRAPNIHAFRNNLFYKNSDKSNIASIIKNNITKLYCQIQFNIITQTQLFV